MTHFFLAAMFAALQSAPVAQPPANTPPTDPATVRLSAQSNAALRCSAAFALVAHGQSNGNAAAKQWPDVDARGREYFVRALASIVDETGVDRDGAALLVQKEAQRLLDAGEIDKVMPACLLLLDASGI